MKKAYLLSALPLLAMTACCVCETTGRHVTATDALKISMVHRGDGKGGLPENSLAALKRCWAHGAVPEADVRRLKDGTYVSYHDDRLAKRPLSDWTYAELKQKCKTLATWEEIFACMKEDPSRRVYMDLKQIKFAEVQAMIRRYGLADRVYCHSGGYNSLKTWHGQMPEGRCSLWCWIGNWRHIDFADPKAVADGEAFMRKCFEAGEKDGFAAVDVVQLIIQCDPKNPNVFCPSEENLRAYVRRAHACGKRITAMPWGDDGKTQGVYRRLLGLGFDGWGTDYPDVMYAVESGEPEGLDYDASVTSKATGFFRIERAANGTWRFVTPGGHGFYMMANNGPQRPSGDWCKALGYDPFGRAVKKNYATTQAWADAAVRRLRSWNFNTVNTWLKPLVPELHGKGLAWTMVLHVGKGFPGRKDVPDANLLAAATNKVHAAFPNVFSPAYAAHCRETARKFCAQHRNDPTLVGWYIDNEIKWNGPITWNEKDREGKGLYDAVAALPRGHSAREALDRYLAARGLTDAATVAGDVKREFLRVIARRYFETTAAAIREVDPNHLILGCRFAGANSMCDVVWEEAGRVCDAVSVNWYPTAEPEKDYVRASWRHHAPSWETRVGEIAALTRKPLIVSEWAYRGGDTGHKNSKGAGQVCKTQKLRATCSALFASKMLASPDMVGYAHFKYVDEPFLGRFDGEDCNYGLVNERDEVYVELTDALRDVQGKAYESRR